MENLGIICGIILGSFGAIFSIVQFFWQKKQAKKQAEIQAIRDKERAEQQALRDKERAEQQAAHDKEIIENCFKEVALRDKVRDEIQAYKDKERAEQQAIRDKEQDLKDRLAFLVQVIIDKDIPRESRQPFFDEYLNKGGNGTVIKFWFEGA